MKCKLWNLIIPLLTNMTKLTTLLQRNLIISISAAALGAVGTNKSPHHRLSYAWWQVILHIRLAVHCSSLPRCLSRSEPLRPFDKDFGVSSTPSPVNGSFLAAVSILVRSHAFYHRRPTCLLYVHLPFRYIHRQRYSTINDRSFGTIRADALAQKLLPPITSMNTKGITPQQQNHLKLHALAFLLVR